MSLRKFFGFGDDPVPTLPTPLMGRVVLGGASVPLKKEDIKIVTAPVEPKTGLETGKWFNDERCWMYKGTYHLVLQFHKKTVEHCTEPYVVSKCAACEASRLKAQYGSRVKRWLILPP